MSINTEMSALEFIQKNYLILRKNTSNLEDLCAFFVQIGTLNTDEIERIKSPFLNATSSDKNEKLYEFLSKKEIPNEILKNALITCGNSHLLEIGGQSSKPTSEPSNSAVSKFEGNLTEEPRRNIPGQNIPEIEIVQSEYILNEENVETILNWAKENYTVKELECEDISTSRVPQILNKFKSIEIFKYLHNTLINRPKSNARRESMCLFKMEDLAGYTNLKILHLFHVEVHFPATFPNLPGLDTFFLDFCDISGDLINSFICSSNLQELELHGITPMLTKENVEVLLRMKSLKLIIMGKHIREIFPSSFTPIGPDGAPMQEITPNAKIVFIRESFYVPWTQSIEFFEITDLTFTLNPENVYVILSSGTQNFTVGWLTCSNISTQRISDIMKKFKNVERLEFSHDMNDEGECLTFEAPKKSLFSFFGSKPDPCLFKMNELNGFKILNILFLENIMVEFPTSYSESLPGLKILEIINCSLIGNFIQAISCCTILKELELIGLTPILSKEDVERLLRIKSLKVIALGKHNNREVFNSSFKPIGPDGVPMDNIELNTRIEFVRESYGKPWAQNMEQIEFGEFHLRNRNIESILNSPIENTTTTHLNCSNIPTMKVPNILKKFKSIEKLKFIHQINQYNECAYYDKEEENCLFKMDDLNGYSNLKSLYLFCIDLAIPQTFLNLPGLDELELEYCNISGDFINKFVCRSNLKVLKLCETTPPLTKENVEALLRSKSLKEIIQEMYKSMEIFTSSFTPIGPDGNQIEEIKPNSKIWFKMDSFGKDWEQILEIED